MTKELPTGVSYDKNGDRLIIRWRGVPSEGRYEHSDIWTLRSGEIIGVMIDDFSYSVDDPRPLLSSLSDLDVATSEVNLRQIVSNCLE